MRDFFGGGGSCKNVIFLVATIEDESFAKYSSWPLFINLIGLILISKKIIVREEQTKAFIE
jgi:hypothetical protein